MSLRYYKQSVLKVSKKEALIRQHGHRLTPQCASSVDILLL